MCVLEHLCSYKCTYNTYKLKAVFFLPASCTLLVNPAHAFLYVYTYKRVNLKILTAVFASQNLVTLSRCFALNSTTKWILHLWSWEQDHWPFSLSCYLRLKRSDIIEVIWNLNVGKNICQRVPLSIIRCVTDKKLCGVPMLTVCWTTEMFAYFSTC